MRYSSFLPKFFFFVLLALVAGAALPGAGDLAVAEDKKEDDAGPDEPTDFWEGETTFSPKEVEIAIRKGVTWLKKKQQRNGSWGEVRGNSIYGGGDSGQGDRSYTHPAGPTALAIFTLLKCKELEKDPVIKKGFDYLKKYKKPGGSYETAMLLLALTATADKFKTSKGSKQAGEMGRIKLKGKYRSWATKLVDHLIDKKSAKGWRYNVDSAGSTPGGPQDVSSTQLAALGLFAAHRAGIKVKKKIWEDILAFSMAQQEDDGPEIEYPDPVDKSKVRKARARGFAYIKGQEHPDEGGPTGGMTACALANIEMSRFVLSDGMSKKTGGRDKWHKRRDAEDVQTALYDGLAWLEANWSPFDNPKKTSMNIYHIYWLYAVERAMDLFDLRLVGTHDWYNEMGQELLNRQHKEGYWKSGSTHEPEDVIDTCFALLFLKRSTAGSIPFGSITGGGGDPIDSR